MDDGASLASQLAEQRECDHALARPRSAADDDHALAISAPCALDGVEHRQVRLALLGDEGELLAVLDLLGSDGEQLPTRPHAHGLELVSGLRSGPSRVEATEQELVQLGATVPRDHATERRLLQLPQRTDAMRRRVVEEGDTTDGIGLVGETGDEVEHVLAIALHLRDRVEHRPVSVRRDLDQLPLVLVQMGVAPLLEFHHHVGRLARPGVIAGQYSINALARQRQLVLEHDLDRAQAGLHQLGREDRDAAVPRADFRWGGPTRMPVQHLLQETLRDALPVVDRERTRGLTHQRH